MTADPPLQLATLQDAADVAEMSRRLIEHGLPWRWRVERVARAIRSAHTNVVVVRDAGALLAFGIMEIHDPHAHLVLFAVRPERQRQGVGSAVLRWLEASARVAGVERIVVEARRDNVAARSFYNEHGYHERDIESRMYGGALDGVHLVKWLRAAP
jgi:ribosomal-protein-alanine N-acetyltransferase